MTFRTGASFAVLLVSAFVTGSADSAEVRIRKHVDDMSSTEWKALNDAIAALHNLDKRDGSGKLIVPQGVDSYERFVQIHGDFHEHGACLHGSEMVWFWHRAFLLHFEDRLRATNVAGASNITLPYWDWTELATGSRGYPSAYEGAFPALLHDRNDHTATAKRLSPLSVARDSTTEIGGQFVDGILKNSKWDEFGGTMDGPASDKGSLEAETHDEIHGTYIGKENRNSIRSANDPIFWAHHSNLDRLVDRWQSMHPDSAKCISCTSVAYERDQQLGPLTVNDLISNNSLKGIQIVYAPRTTLVAKADIADHVATAMLASEQGSVTGTWSAYKVVIPTERSDRVRLTVPGIAISSGTYYRTDIYLVPEGVKFEPTRDFKTKYRVANFGNFPAHSVDAHGQASARTTKVGVDLTDAVQKLPDSEKGKSYQIIVHFVPGEASASPMMAASGKDVTHGAPELSFGGDSSNRKSMRLEAVGGTQK
jgi:Common central domain of tyrosinase